MTNGRLVAGVDCSTQATKIVVVDTETGETVATGRASHVVVGADGAAGVGGAYETDPEEWWAALRIALADTGRASDLSAISIAGQQHGLVVLGRDHRPLRNAILWNDTRSAVDAERLVAACGPQFWADRTGSRPLASLTVSKWAWLRRMQPDVAAATTSVRLPHDYLTERLTGRAVTDRGDASGTGWWSPADGAYAEDVLARPELALPTSFLPQVLGPADSSGDVRSAAAVELGLTPGVVVGPGTGDNMAAALGLDLAVGQVAMSLGTSGTVFSVAAGPSADPTGTVAGFADASGRFLPLACTLNCTLAVERMAEWLRIDRDDVEPAGEVVVLPYLDGERTPNLPGASGTIVGLRHSTAPQAILMATYEGAVASLLEAIAAIGESAGGLDPSAPLILVGGGARGRTWREVVRRLSGRAVLLPDAQELVAIGAAVQAASVLLNEAPSVVARRWRTVRGELLDSVARDDGRATRIKSVRDAVVSSAVLSGGGR